MTSIIRQPDWPMRSLVLPAIVRPMFSSSSPTLRSGSVALLILGLAASTDLALSSTAFAGPSSVTPCPAAAATASPVAAAARTSANDVLLAQALPSNQPVGVEMGEPACTYDPIVPARPQIIRGLW